MESFHDHNRFSLPAAVERHYKELTTFAARKVRCRTLAAELVHEAYIRVRTGGGEVGIENPLAYLYRIVINLVTDHYRKNVRCGSYVTTDPILENVPDDRPTIDVRIDEQRRLALLDQAVDELPPRCREVFRLRKYHAMNQAAIAERLGISRNMVEKHLRKALLYCRDRVQQLTDS